MNRLNLTSVELKKVPWVIPQYSRGQVNRAGEVLKASGASDEELAAARRVLSNWRSSHGYPLFAFNQTLRKRAEQVARDSIASHRVKRLSSIERKLIRHSRKGLHLRATQIQDIGGARIVFPRMSQVRALARYYDGARRGSVFSKHKRDDYVRAPRSTGYRSVHLIFKYRSGYKPEHDNQRLELQLRSIDQHAWATAVEAVSFFLGEDLKAGEGEERWLRFFQLMAGYIALEEGEPSVPGVPDSQTEFFDELEHLWVKLDVDALLSGWAASLNYMSALTEEDPNTYRFLLHLDARAYRLDVRQYRRREEDVAAAEQEKLEVSYADDPFQHIALVSVEDVKSLDKAYPGFYGDTHRFRRLARVAVGERRVSTQLSLF